MTLSGARPDDQSMFQLSFGHKVCLKFIPVVIVWKRRYRSLESERMNVRGDLFDRSLY